MKSRGWALVVDDDRLVREIMSRAIAALGFDVVTAVDGADALEQCASTRFDLVITDLVMPKLGGLDFIERFVAIQPDVPVLLMTGSPSMGTALAATRLGVRDYLVKPFGIRHIKERVEEALQPRTPSDQVRRQQVHLHNALFTPDGSRVQD